MIFIPMEQNKIDNRRGALPGGGGLVSLAMMFGTAVVGLVIVVILLQSLLGQGTTSCATTTYVYNTTTGLCNNAANASATGPVTTAANVTVNALTFNSNFSNQWGLAGTILGYVLVLGILALIGVGGYMAYSKVRGSR